MNPTRAQVCAAIAMFVPFAPSVVAAQDRTANELLDLIVRDGPRAVAIRAEVDVVRRSQEARLAYPNPAVTYSHESAGFTEFLQVDQTIPAFGRRSALARAGLAATQVAEAERDARLWLLRSDAAEAVARLQAEQARVDVLQAALGEIERVIEVLRTREREGEGSRFDRLRAEQELQDARRLLTSAAVGLAGARAVVETLLPSGVTVARVTSPLYAPRQSFSVDALLVRAEASRPELRALGASLDRAGLEAEAARRARLPMPAVFGGLKRADAGAGRERGAIFGISTSVPLFDTGAREAAPWTAERARIDAERASLERRLRLDVTRASETLGLRQAAVSRDEEGSADELTRIAEIAYREGEMGILELLDAFRTASRADLRSIDIRLDARLAQIALERAVGDVLWP